MNEQYNDVLQSAPTRAPESAEHKRGKGVSFILALFLFVTLVALGERLIYDLNRAVNSHTCPAYSGYQPDYYNRGSSAVSDYARLEQCGQYKITRLFLILALVVPILIGGFALYMRFGFQGTGQYVPLAWSYFAFSFWMFGHLFVETADFLIQQHTTFGIYVVLAVSIALLTLLIWVVQRQRHQLQP